MKRFPFAHALNFRLIPVVVVVAGMGGQLYGQAISLYTPNQSVNEAISTFDNGAGVIVDGNVNSLPYTTVTTATSSTVSSTVTPTFSTSALNLSFSQSTPDNLSSSSGEGTVYFTALNAATFSISGSMTIGGGTHLGSELSAFLLDVNTSTYIYQFDHVQGTQTASGPLTFTLDSAGGPLTGSLTAGDVYEFDAFDANNLYNHQGGQSLTGTTTLTLTAVPEPSSWATLFVGMGMLAGFKCLARKSNASAQA